MTLTWRDLLAPLYVLTFFRGFLTGALPSGGFAHAASNGGVLGASLSNWPTILTILIALGVGALNGLDRVQALATTPPAVPVPEGKR